MCRESLELCPPGHPSRQIPLINLAAALKDRYVHSGSQGDAKESILLARDALELCPDNHLGHARVSFALAQCIRQSLDLQTSPDEIFQILKGGLIASMSPLEHCLLCGLLWIQVASELRHGSLGQAYDHFIAFLRRYLTIGPTVKLQYEALLRRPEILSLPMDAAAYAIEGGFTERAVELLDEGRSLLWSEMRRFREPLLLPESVGNEVAAKFEAICSELQALSTAEARYESIYEGVAPENAAPSSSLGISSDVLFP